MTTTQSRAIWELCRQGLPLAADEAEERWIRGESYHLSSWVKLPRSISALIELCNWESQTMSRLH
jgi:hypothetical protein